MPGIAGGLISAAPDPAGAASKFTVTSVQGKIQQQQLNDGAIWLDMLEKRNALSHSYDEMAAQMAVELICFRYYQQVKNLIIWFDEKVHEK